MARGVKLKVGDGALGVQPPDTGAAFVVVGLAEATLAEPNPFDADGVCAPFTSRDPAAFRVVRGVTKGTLAASRLCHRTGATITFLGFQKTATQTKTFRTVPKTGSTQLTVTLSQDILDDLRIVILWTKGGIIGTDVLEYQISHNGGRDYSGVKSMAGLTIPLAPYAGNLTFTAAETVVAGDYQVAWANAPAGVAKARKALQGAFSLDTDYKGILLASLESDSMLASIALDVDASEASDDYTYFIAETLDIAPDGSQSPAAWMALAATTSQIAVSKRFSPFPTHVPISGGLVDEPSLRRSMAWQLAERQLLNSPQIDPARIESANGESDLLPIECLPPLLFDPVKLANASYSGQYVHDETKTPYFEPRRISSLETLKRRRGYHIVNGRLQSAPGSDFDLIQFIEVMNKAAKEVFDGLMEFYHMDVTLNPAGRIQEVDAIKIEKKILNRMKNALKATGNASAVQFSVSRTDDLNATRTLTCSAGVQPKGYAKLINAGISYVPVVIVDAAA